MKGMTAAAATTTPSKRLTLPIAVLRPSPVRINLHTGHMIDLMADTVMSDGRRLPGIIIAYVGETAYIVDGHARVDAYRKVGFQEVNVSEVLHLDGEVEIVREHVMRNQHSSVNPLKVAAAVVFLEKSGTRDAVKTLGLSPVMASAVGIIRAWPADIRTKVSQVLEAQARKFSDVYALPHFFTAFSDLTDRVRRGDRAAEEELRSIISYIMSYLESVKDEQEFTLPGPDQISAIMRVRKHRMAMFAAASTSSPGSLSKGQSIPPMQSQQSRYDGGNGRNDDDMQGKPPLVFPDKNKSRIQCTHCGKPQVVDLKTGTVCPVEEVPLADGGMIEVIRDGEGRRSYALGPKAVKFLALDRPDDEISPSNYVMIATDKRSEVERVLKVAKPEARFVLFMVE